MGVFNGILTGNCNEINIYSDTEQYGTCNLASISLPAFIELSESCNKYIFNYTKLEETVDTLIRNLNKIIDITFYSTPESEKANKSHRPVGLGVSGFSNVLYQLKIPFESEEAKKINLLIFETIYYASLKTSCDLAKKEGPYSSFKGSDFSKGILQFDYTDEKDRILSGRYNWELLKDEIKKHGTRNSLLTALMPTASTSQILNNFESFEPITRNIFMRSVLSGDFSIINRYLIRDLMDLGLWNESFFNKFKKTYGSIQTFEEIPKHLRDLYKDIYEIPQKVLIDLSADRQHFIDQSQSLNIYFQNPTIKKLTSMHFYGWKKGLKTGMYYLRSDSATQAAQVTVSKSTTQSLEEQKLMCSINNRENCDMCSG
jgi:ribonucleoside-diphosphate reductase alpha subunit